MDKRTIGKLAEACGIGVETIRFYEKEGLILRPVRKGSGYRVYAENTVSQVRFIRQAKDLGFSLKEIRELLDLRLDGEQACDEACSAAETKIAQIQEKIDLLQRMRGTLGELVDACKRKMQTETCPILRAIAKEDES